MAEAGLRATTSRVHIQRAAQLLSQQQFDAAVIEADSALAMDPDSLPAQILHVRIAAARATRPLPSTPPRTRQDRPYLAVSGLLVALTLLSGTWMRGPVPPEIIPAAPAIPTAPPLAQATVSEIPSIPLPAPPKRIRKGQVIPAKAARPASVVAVTDGQPAGARRVGRFFTSTLPRFFGVGLERGRLE